MVEEGNLVLTTSTCSENLSESAARGTYYFGETLWPCFGSNKVFCKYFLCMKIFNISCGYFSVFTYFSCARGYEQTVKQGWFAKNLRLIGAYSIDPSQTPLIQAMIICFITVLMWQNQYKKWNDSGGSNILKPTEVYWTQYRQGFVTTVLDSWASLHPLSMRSQSMKTSITRH